MASHWATYARISAYTVLSVSVFCGGISVMHAAVAASSAKRVVQIVCSECETQYRAHTNSVAAYSTTTVLKS